jgi:hypothetical protein
VDLTQIAQVFQSPLVSPKPKVMNGKVPGCRGVQIKGIGANSFDFPLLVQEFNRLQG